MTLRKSPSTPVPSHLPSSPKNNTHLPCILPDILPKNQPQSFTPCLEFQTITRSLAKSASSHSDIQPHQCDLVVERDSYQGQTKAGSCPGCHKWQKWAALHERNMLLLEQQLIQSSQRMLLEQQNWSKSFQQQQKQLETQINKNKQLAKYIEVLTQKTSGIKPEPLIVSTPSKNKKQPKKQQSLGDYNMRYSQFVSQNKPSNKASTIVTKPALDSLFTTTHKKQLTQWPQNIENDMQLQKYMFQNQILKDYNVTLLQRLRQSKHRR